MEIVLFILFVIWGIYGFFKYPFTKYLICGNMFIDTMIHGPCIWIAALIYYIENKKIE